MKIKKWVIIDTRKRYLVYRTDDFREGVLEASKFVWVKDKRRATRYNREIEAELAMKMYFACFGKHDEFIMTMEVWE